MSFSFFFFFSNDVRLAYGDRRHFAKAEIICIKCGRIHLLSPVLTVNVSIGDRVSRFIYVRFYAMRPLAVRKLTERRHYIYTSVRTPILHILGEST